MMRGSEDYSLLPIALNCIHSEPSNNTDWKSEDQCYEKEVLSVKATKSWAHTSKVLESGLLVIVESHGDFVIDGK